MSEILNFPCPIDNCGRKFATKEKLDNHIKLRHPQTSKNINNKKNNKIEKEENKIIENKNNEKTKIKEQKKEKLEKEKNKIILDDLYSKINSLENYFEKENLELQKQFEIPEMHIEDNILLENEKLEQEENIIEKDNIDLNNNDNKEKTEEKNNINIEKEVSNNDMIIKDEIKEENKIVEKPKEKNDYNLNDNKKNYDKDKIITITEELIISNSDSKEEEDLELITSLDLSKKNIASFMNNRDVNFSEIPNLKKLNISYNWMTYTYDLRLFVNLEELYLNDNKIDDISFVEFLPLLKILNCENNEITYITSLKKCHNLKSLKLSLNKIQYLNSTLNVFKCLNLLEELTIKDNPFLSQIFAYKQYFLYEYQNLLKFENEEINDIDRDIAGRFVRKNNSMYKNTPIYNSAINDDEIKNVDEDNKEKTTFRVGNTIITKEMVVPYKGKGKSIFSEKNNSTQKKKKNKEENSKNKELKDIIKNQQKEIDDIKLELENVNQLNREYEIIIEDYKNKIEQNKVDNKTNINSKDSEKNKLLKELEMWKKEYLDLFNKINKSSLFPTSINEDLKSLKVNLIKRGDKEIENENIINTDLIKSMPNKEIKQLIERPQTAQVRRTNPDNFETLCEGLKIMYSKNELMDVVEEESDEEEEEEIKEKEINDKKDVDNVDNTKEENEDEIDYDGNDIIPDDEIDELFRKSCADLQKMKDEIKFMNENIDKSGNNIFNNNLNINLNNNGGKTKLNPVIIKRENNPNFIGNKIIFGNKNQKKI